MNSSSTWLADACTPLAMIGRIGSTRPMPMNATMHANSTAQIAFGCLLRPMLGLPGRAAPSEADGAACADDRLTYGYIATSYS